MAKVWGAPGAWAADVEEEEKLAKEMGKSFPSLGEAAAKKEPKKKKGGTTLSLSEFNAKPSGTFMASRSRGVVETEKLTYAEKSLLPTGPRERADEPSDRLGGGFRDYGGGRYGDREDRDRGRDRFGDGGREDEGPSRADGDSNWGASKVFNPSPGMRDRGFGGGFDRDDDRRTSDRDLPSRADEAGSWGANKKFVPTRGGGFDDRRGGGFDDSYKVSRADEDGAWGASKRASYGGGPPPRSFDHGRRDAGPDSSDRWGARREPVRDEVRSTSDLTERPRLNLQKRTIPVDAPTSSSSPQSGGGGGATKPDIFGGAKPREEVLPEKDPRKSESGDDSKPSSRASSRPHTPDTENMPVKPKPKINPFGEAKPREVLLEEKGLDWRKIDLELEHRVMDRPETEEEQRLKLEIKELEEKIKNGSSAGNGTAAVEGSENANGSAHGDLESTLKAMQKELAQLTLSEDDKVRFAQRAEIANRKRLDADVRTEMRGKPAELNGRRPW